MKNKDLILQARTEIMQRMQAAIDANDMQVLMGVHQEWMQNIHDEIMEDAKECMSIQDTSILNARGTRQLTVEEREYYQKVTDAMRSSNPKQALTDLNEVLPKTVIDQVFADLQDAHQLLNVINFQNTSGLIEMIINTGSKQLATWATLTARIVTELTGGFKKVQMSQKKLSAFMPVAKAMLDLGPEWLDRYVRTLLQEALYLGLEEGIINGSGKDMPIGMNRQVGEGVTVTGGVYPIKATVAVASLDPITYGRLLSGMATTSNGHMRIVQNVVMVVNPVDYLEKIMPSTTVRSADGTYVSNVFPFPTTVIQSVQVPKNRMIVGLADRYFMGIGTAKSGKIEYSDEYHFLEDERVYLVKLYGHGEPLDNNAFVYADISGLKPAIYEVYVANTETNAIPTKITGMFDARLSNLKIGDLALSPGFNKSIFYYECTTTNATNIVTATRIDAEAQVAVMVNGTAITNGAAATWVAGTNNVVVNVVSGTEAETYTVKVTK